MLSFFLMLTAGVLFPTMPGLALVLGCIAVWGAMSWSGDGIELLEMLFFYGALIGCLTVWL